MKEYLRKEIIDALYQYANGTAKPITEDVVSYTWNVDVIKEMIRNASINQLHGAGATFVLVTNWCLLGADELITLNSSVHGIMNIFPDKTSCYEEGQKQLRYAMDSRDIGYFFDWYEQIVLYPLGFTVDEINHLYEAIELCCMKLCREMRGVAIHRELSRGNISVKENNTGSENELLYELGPELAAMQEEIEENREHDEYYEAETKANDYHLPIDFFLKGH